MNTLANSGSREADTRGRSCNGAVEPVMPRTPAMPRPRGTRLAPRSSVRVRDVEFAGHAALELIADGIRMIVVHDVGPRIAWFGFTSRDSLLFWDEPESRARGAWRLYGGHRLWLARP